MTPQHRRSDFQSALALLPYGPGEPLPARLRARLECLIGEDLGSVRIHAGPSAASAARRLGARAFALGEHVVIGETASDPTSSAGLAILVHELAHVLQQRAGRTPGAPPAPRPLLEAEAHAAACAVIRGEPWTRRLADPSGLPARWELAGHYYTPYLLMLTFGFDPDVARRMAQWCWLPDQVNEFDAAHIGFRRFWWSDAWQHASGNMEKYGRLSYNSEMHWIRCVHQGLHVLTGGDAYAETRRRRELFLDTKRNGLLVRGLALHAFGDCFAHRQMTGPLLGRYVTDGSDTLSGCLAPFGHARDLGEGDHIWDPQRGHIFVSYVRALYGLFETWGVKASRPVDDLVAAMAPMLDGLPFVYDKVDRVVTQEELRRQPRRRQVVSDWSSKDISDKARRLSEVPDIRTEEGCADHLCRIASDLLGRSMRNATDNTHLTDGPRPWADYWSRMQGDLRQDTGHGDGEYVYYIIQTWAARWAGAYPTRAAPPVVRTAGEIVEQRR